MHRAPSLSLSLSLLASLSLSSWIFFSASAPVLSCSVFPRPGRARAVQPERERSSRPRAARRPRLHTRSARGRCPHQNRRGADGWHVAHYVICPLDQSTCGAHFFPASERKKGRTKKCASGITPVAADQSPYVKRHFLWAPPRAHPRPRASLFNSFSLPRPAARFV